VSAYAGTRPRPPHMDVPKSSPRAATRRSNPQRRGRRVPRRPETDHVRVTGRGGDPRRRLDAATQPSPITTAAPCRGVAEPARVPPAPRDASTNLSIHPRHPSPSKKTSNVAQRFAQ
jgi:hypothetical protein